MSARWLPEDGPLRWALLLVVALSAAWALMTPLGAVPDEPAHVIYAAAAVRGELGGGDSGREVRVPSGAAAAAEQTCMAFRADVTADCAPRVSSGAEPVVSDTSAARYPPLYYVLVGWPTLLGFGEATWYVMRLLSVLLGGALLLLGARAWPPTRLPVAASIVVAVSPMTAFLAGSVNPNGPEIVAGIAMALAGTGLLQRMSQSLPLQPALVGLAATSGYLSVARPSSWAACAALAGVLAVVGHQPLRHRWRQQRRARGLWMPALIVVTSVVFGFLTDLALPAADQAGAVGRPLSPASALSLLALNGDSWLLETAGMFGWRDHEPWLLLRLCWMALPVGLAVAAWLVASAGQRAGLGLLVLGATIGAPLAVLVAVLPGGIGYQGRYVMTLTQAIPVVAASLLCGAGSRVSGRATSLMVAAATALNTVALSGSFLRYAVGLPLPLDLRQSLHELTWAPPAWPLVLLLLGAVAVAAWRLTRAFAATGSEPLARPVRASTP